MTISGVDVAGYQGPPGDWQKSAGSIDFAAVKISEYQPGSIYINPDARADWDYLQHEGKGRIAYLFGHPSAPVDKTVLVFASELAKLGIDNGDGIALDLETNDGTVSPADVALWAGDVLAALEVDFDRAPLLYTYRNFAAAGNCAGLERYPLWISAPSDPRGRPTVPAPWTSWAIHQYSTSGQIDRDVAAYPDLAAMRAALGKRHRRVIHWDVKKPLVTLAGAAKRHQTTPPAMVRLAHREGHVYAGRMAKIIERRNWSAHVPIGTELFAWETP